MAEPAPDKEQEAPGAEGGGPRIGVYVCHCGGNISDVVDVEQVAQAAAKLPNVVVVRRNMFMCSDPGQNMVCEDIENESLDRVVIAACSPSLHEFTFRRTLVRAGLNPYLFEPANIREQVSWVSKSDPQGATDKATRLVAAATAKAGLLAPLEPIRVDAGQLVAVIGGGIAGLRCAQDLSRRGFRVTLIERSPALGGHMAELGRVYPTEEMARDLLNPLLEEVSADSNILTLTRAEVIAASGYVGNFRLTVRRGPAESNSGAQAEETEIEAGAIVVATGFDHYEPRKGEYGYEEHPQVVTLPQFIRLLGEAGPASGKLTHNGRTIENVCLIHCVGSRQVEGVHEPGPDGQVNDYCSRVCCTAALRTANEVRERFPGVNVFDFYQDIRTYGRGHETYYEDSCRGGVMFFRYTAEVPPVVAKPESQNGSPLVVRVKDTLTFGEELEAPADLVVLVTGMVPADISGLVEMLKLPRSADRFLQEVHPKLRPVELAVDGVLIAGTCQAPMDITESCAAASAVAAKAAALLATGTIELDPFVAHVDLEQCDGCGDCVEECRFTQAITLVDTDVGGRREKRAAVNTALCMGCGMCVAVCRPRAIEVAGWRLDQFEAMVDALAADY